MPLVRNLIGTRFGRLLVISKYGVSKRKKSTYFCECECGGVSVIEASQLSRGDTKSCGCLQSEARKKPRKSGTLGMANSPEYQAWKDAHKRCANPLSRDYKNYGARGISVCKEWSRFESFLSDMGLRPSASHSLDRINNDGNYEPGNCRWATAAEQRSNQRRTKSSIGGIEVTENKKFRAVICRNRKRKNLGTFDCFFDACCARRSAELSADPGAN